MGDRQTVSKTAKRYTYRLLRYRPTESGEFYNVAIVLEDEAGKIADARFAPDFDRLACNPAADVHLLEQVRAEFDESRLLGEGFAERLRGLTAGRYPLFEQSRPATIFGGDLPAEIDRLVGSYLATAPAPARLSGPPGGRQAIRRRMGEVFERHGLVGNGGPLRRKTEALYGPNLRFRFDFGYAPAAGGMHYLHAFPDRNGVGEAGRLCFVMEHLANRDDGRRLTVVHANAESDALALLESNDIEASPVEGLEDLALALRSDLGL